MGRRIALALVVACSCAFVGGAAQAAPDPPGVQFTSHDTLELGGTTKLSVTNTTKDATPVEVSLVITGLTPKSTSDAGAIADVLTLDPAAGTVPGDGGSLDIAIYEDAATTAKVKDDTYDGLLRLVVDDKAVDTRPVSFRVGAAVVTKPEATTWKVDRSRYRWGTSYQTHEDLIPLAKGTAGTTFSQLATLRGSNGGALRVSGTVVERANRPYLELDFHGAQREGTYEGSIDLAPDDKDAGTVALTVTQRDEWPVPVAVLALSIALLWWLQRRLTNTFLRKAKKRAEKAKDDLDERADTNADALSQVAAELMATGFARQLAQVDAWIATDEAELERLNGLADDLDEGAESYRLRGLAERLALAIERLRTRRDHFAAKWVASTGADDPLADPTGTDGSIELGRARVATFASEVQELRRSLGTRLAPVTADDPVRTTIEHDVTALESAAKIWTAAEIGQQVKALRAAIRGAGATGAAHRPPGATSSVPGYLQPARTLLTTPVEVVDLPARQAQLLAMTKYVTTRNKTLVVLDWYQEPLEVLSAGRPYLAPTERQMVDQANQLVAGVRWDLWHATGPSDLVARKTLDELLRAEEIIGQLSYHLVEAPVATSEPADIGRATVMETFQHDAGRLFSLGSAAEVILEIWDVVDDLAPVELVRKVLPRAIDGSLVLVTFALALWASMVLLYVGKPFGTLYDYGLLVAAGLGATAAVDAVNGVFTKLSPTPGKTDPGGSKAAAPTSI